MGLNVHDIDAEETEQEPIETPEGDEVEQAPADAPAPDAFQALLGALGEIPDQPNPEILKRLKPEDLSRLPADVRGLLQVQASLLQHGYQQKLTATEQRAAEVEARAKALDDETRKLIQQRADLGRVVNSEKFRSLLSEAEKIDLAKLDPLSPEGRAALVKKEVGEALKTWTDPLRAEADRASREAAWESFKVAHPDVATDATLRKAMADHVRTLKERGAPVDLEAVYKVVSFDRQQAALARQRKTERAARAASAARSATRVASGNRGAPSSPDQIKKAGYKGEYGNRAYALWLIDNPQHASR